MGIPVADRLRWAVEQLAVGPSDRLLEIGCGNGAAVSLICSSLEDGTILAIDQSEKRILSAMKRNTSYISEGKASFLASAFGEADLGQYIFDKIFAVNVNLFWMEAARELEIIKERLLPGGTVYLFNQPPNSNKVRDITERTTCNLQNAGFAVRSVIIGDQKPVPVLCVIGNHNG
ncbi:class I SAM-dependent methyltransferase [Neobacillus sp. YIM B06451]|uniref:class I SAM-dependent methyltransferase n=1 Tax=Neobacillus sp. YIM B06451 TaxID=3070994 RepID=UPI00292FDBBC|nr:class I SAM-dependent methyltransferase [Neobacillus sp. YIM B06451]